MDRFAWRRWISARLARRGFARARRAAAAVEFAITSVALFTFLMGIINLGDLGLVLGALQHGVQGAARQAAVVAAGDLASGTACPANGDIQSYFNAFATPPLAANSAVPSFGGGGSPWVSNDATLPGSYVVLTETYNWVPIGFSPFGTGFSFSLTAAGFVMGSSASVTC